MVDNYEEGWLYRRVDHSQMKDIEGYMIEDNEKKDG